MQTIPQIPSSRLKPIIALLLVTAVLIPYWQVGGFDFIHMDDEDYVTENPIVLAGVTVEGIVRALTSFHSANWHPLTWLSHMIDCELYGLDPRGHHWTNVQFHGMNTVLLFVLLHQMTGALGRSALVAALFGLHPLHVESVAWVAERKDVLSTFLGLLMLMAYARYAKQPRLSRYLPVLLLFALGLAAKPMLVTFPFLMLLLDIWPLKRIHPISPSVTGISGSPPSSMQQFASLLAEKIPLLILATGSCIITYLAQQKGGAVGSFEIITPGIRIANALGSYLSYLGKAVWPYPLVVFYPHPGSAISIAHALGAGIAIASITAIAVLVIRRYPYVGVGWLWYLGALVPVIGLVQVGSQAMADRYTYIPLIGIFIIVAWGATDLLRRWRHQRPILAVAAILILSILTVRTHYQVRHWENSISLFAHAVETTEDNWLAYNNLGTALDIEGRLAESVTAIRKALAISPGYVAARYNLGLALYKQGNNEAAMVQYRNALDGNPDHPGAHLNLANLLAARGQTEAAIHHYGEALRVVPANSDAHNNLAVVFGNQGDTDKARHHFEEALRLNPRSVDANHNYGSFLLKHGERKAAMGHIARALSILHNTEGHAIKPFYARVYFDMGVGLAERGQTEAAIVFFRKALEIKPDYEDARHNLRLLSKMPSVQ